MSAESTIFLQKHTRHHSFICFFHRNTEVHANICASPVIHICYSTKLVDYSFPLQVLMVQIISAANENNNNKANVFSQLVTALSPHVLLRCIRATQDAQCCQHSCGGLFYSPSFLSNPTYPCGPPANTIINTNSRKGKKASKAAGEIGMGTFSSSVSLAGSPSPNITECFCQKKSLFDTYACHDQTNRRITRY